MQANFSEYVYHGSVAADGVPVMEKLTPPADAHSWEVTTVRVATTLH